MTDLSPYADADTDASVLTVMPSTDAGIKKKDLHHTDKSDCQTATISAQPREHLYPL
jgi:hypothetical protein